jgi:hypothetical protein
LPKQAVPTNKALEDDVSAALVQVGDLNIVALELSNSLQYFDLRVDLELLPISINIIDQLNSLNVKYT